jgi:hypothetical protein
MPRYGGGTRAEYEYGSGPMRSEPEQATKQVKLGLVGLTHVHMRSYTEHFRTAVTQLLKYPVRYLIRWHSIELDMLTSIAH